MRGKYYIGTGLTGGSWGEGLQVPLVAVADGGDSCRDKHWCNNGVQGGSRAHKSACLVRVQELIIHRTLPELLTFTILTNKTGAVYTAKTLGLL